MCSSSSLQADCCTEPKDIYAFLEANSIGQDHALYYEAFATYLEIHKNYKRANEIFELGIARFVNQLIICKLISSRSLVWNEFFGGGEMKREKGDKKRRLFYQQCWGFFWWTLIASDGLKQCLSGRQGCTSNWKAAEYVPGLPQADGKTDWTWSP